MKIIYAILRIFQTQDLELWFDVRVKAERLTGELSEVHRFEFRKMAPWNEQGVTVAENLETAIRQKLVDLIGEYPDKTPLTQVKCL